MPSPSKWLRPTTRDYIGRPGLEIVNARTVVARGAPDQTFWDIWDNFWYRR